MLGTGEGGNERYIENLSLALTKQKNLVTNIYANGNYQILDKNLKNFFIIKKKIGNTTRIFFSLPKMAKSINADIIHATYVGPVFSSAKLVLTVHDFAFKRFPDFFSAREKIIFNFLLPISMSRAAAIIVPSNFVKKELAHYYPQHAKKTFVTHEAATKNIRVISKKTAQKRVMKKFGIESPYLLTLNSRYDKRNINRVIDAYAQIKPNFPDLQLVILGGNHNIRTKTKRTKIKIVSDVSDEDLSHLYSAAEVLIYYSLYEGFGLPILEAFKCKTPVIVSDISVHREVAGSAAIFADPYNSDNLAKEIGALVKNPKKIKTMSKKGYQKTLEYSWQKTAKETIKAYRFALKNK